MRRAVALAFASAACGRVGFAPSGADADTADGVAPGFCDTATFTTPPASALVDDFTAPTWTSNAACVTVTPSEVTAAPASNSTDYCFVRTVVDRRLTCDAFTVYVPEVTQLGLRSQTFAYVRSGTEAIDILVEVGLQMYRNGQRLVGTDYDLTRDAWWRVRERDGVLYLDTASDGIGWVERLQTPTPFSFDDVRIVLGAGTYEPLPNPGQARFRCFNRPPPCS